MSDLLKKRFRQLKSRWETILATRQDDEYGGQVEREIFLTWKVNVKNLISKACGENSEHYRAFLKEEEAVSWSGSYNLAQRLGAIFVAARDDFEGGYCSSIKTLIQAEVFDNELEQARELHSNGYHSAAAVVAGVVLETTLRQLCDDNQLAHAKLDKMNADLVKAGQYNKLRQKQVTAWADIRNSAAHGNSTEFSPDDVSDMIEKIESFVADQLS